MKYVRVALAALTTAATAVVLFGSVAHAALPQTLDLSTRFPVERFDHRLRSGHWYVVTAAGTASFFKPSMWTSPTARWRWFHVRAIICGTPEAAPMFPTPGATGKVGFDAETLFARPATRRSCRRDPSPHTSRRFQLDNGGGFRHPTTLTGRYSVPRGDHTYSYPIRGLGKKLIVRVRDWPFWWDNYGALQLTLRKAEDADCAGSQWRNFTTKWGSQVFDDQAECEAAL